MSCIGQTRDEADVPDAPEAARLRLLQLLDRTTHAAQQDPAGTLLSVHPYSPMGLKDYLDRAHTINAHKYESYLSRRRSGGPRELVPDREYAVQWLKVASVVKYVDGAWVANCLGPAGPSAASNICDTHMESGIRNAAKLAFQVISEEFGDGDLRKNHVYVYHELMKSLGQPGRGDELAFDGLGPDEGSPRCWTAAVAQQCIGLLASADAYMPEALGFNMAYETLPYHLLATSYELRELKIDDYYFALHITIDNPDSGHGALARVAVERYLETVRKRDGEEAMDTAWRRVQAGANLADGLPTTPAGPIEFQQDKTTEFWRPVSLTPTTPNANSSTCIPATEVESRFVRLLMRKAPAAEKMHCPSRILIKGQTIEQWLDPNTITSDRCLALMRGLASKRPWIIPGDPDASRFIQLLGWGGRMFGAFSKAETELVREWIVSLNSDPRSSRLDGAYTTFVGSAAPALSSELLVSRMGPDEVKSLLDRFAIPDAAVPHSLTELTTSSPLRDLDLTKLAPVWFATISLLELYHLSPAKFATPLGSAVLRIYRAMLGFAPLHRESDICAGMDGVESDVRGLWEIGHTLFEERNGDDELVKDLWYLRSRPYSQPQQAIALGSLYAFARLVLVNTTLLASISPGDRDRVGRIAEDMLDALHECVERESTDTRAVDGERWWADFVGGCRRLERELFYL